MKPSNITKNYKCRICQSKALIRFLDFGKMPLANGFLRMPNYNEPKYPLRVYFCEDCYLVQLRDIVDKSHLFRDYIYFSSGMPKLSEHFKGYAGDIIRRFLNKNDFVVELGSNDGILLKHFENSGFNVLGVDPATNIPKQVETIEDFFSENLARKIIRKYGPAKAIIANNVVAHINDHHDLVKGLDILLDKDGVFVFEAPYLLDMIENLAYDTIYHEHLACLSLMPLVKLFGQFGLYVFDIKIFPVQGQSLRVFVCRPGQYNISKRVKEYLDLEQELKFDKINTYFNLAKNINKSQNRLINLLKKLKSQDKKISVYGASARGNVVLNSCGIDFNIIDYAVDDLPSKQGLYTPGTHIPVISSLEARKKYPDYFLLLAWNYLQPILKKEQEFIKQGGKFILPLNSKIT